MSARRIKRKSEAGMIEEHSEAGMIEEITDAGMIEEKSEAGMIEEISESALGERMYNKATSQCKVLHPALNNPQCNDETRKSLISIIRNILSEFPSNGKEIKRRKEQIYLENPDFFPKESELIRAKMKLKPHLEAVKSDIKQRRAKKIKPADRISGTVIPGLMIEGIQKGIISKPKNIKESNKQAEQIRKNLGNMLQTKKEKDF